MYVSDDYRNSLADYAKEELVHEIALIDPDDNIITDGHEPEWDTDETGRLALAEDINFSIDEGETVAGWRAYQNTTTSGNEQFGASLPEESYSNDGQYILEAENTYIEHMLCDI